MILILIPEMNNNFLYMLPDFIVNIQTNCVVSITKT